MLGGQNKIPRLSNNRKYLDDILGKKITRDTLKGTPVAFNLIGDFLV